MKRVILVTILLLLFLLPACAETPKEDIVVGKNDGVMKEIIDSTTQADASDQEIKCDRRQQGVLKYIGFGYPVQKKKNPNDR